MSGTFDTVLELLKVTKVLISQHGYDEMVYDNVLMRDVMKGVQEAVIVEDYPDYHKGPCVLVLQHDLAGAPIHVVWGIPKTEPFCAVLVTAYRPDPDRWEDSFTRRRR